MIKCVEDFSECGDKDDVIGGRGSDRLLRQSAVLPALTLTRTLAPRVEQHVDITARLVRGRALWALRGHRELVAADCSFGRRVDGQKDPGAALLHDFHLPLATFQVLHQWDDDVRALRHYRVASWHMHTHTNAKTCSCRSFPPLATISSTFKKGKVTGGVTERFSNRYVISLYP